MRDNFKFLIKLLLRLLLKIYYVFPIRKRIFFMSTFGKSYSCNPKYLYESMMDDHRFSDYSFVWCFVHPDEVDVKGCNRTKIIKKGNHVLFFYYILTSKIIVYNCGGFSFVPIRKKQFLLETWHGGGTFKRVNLTVANKSESSKKGIRMASNDVKAFIGTCEVNDKMFIREGMGYTGEIIKSGFPRNDILFIDDNDFRQNIKKKLGLDKNVHYVLYAPTFKGHEHNAVNLNSNVESISPNLVVTALQHSFGGEWKFVTRGHQYVGELSIKSADDDWSPYPDMQELLVAADVLITDYSSSIWDFALTGKPCFLYVPDLEEYAKDERGFLRPIDTWPGITALNNNELVERIINFNKKAYVDKVSEYLTKCGSYETGEACGIVKDYLYEHVSVK